MKKKEQRGCYKISGEVLTFKYNLSGGINCAGKFRSEHWEQCKVFEIARENALAYPELRFLTGSLSGIKMSIGTAMKAKKAGCLVKGIPDLFLPLRRKAFPGLYIELKRLKGGKILTDQREWREFLIAQGYAHYFCKGHETAWQKIIEYLESD